MSEKVSVAGFCIEISGPSYEAYIDESLAFKRFRTNAPADFHIISDLDSDRVTGCGEYSGRQVLYRVSFEGIDCDFARAGTSSGSAGNISGKFYFTMEDSRNESVLVQSWQSGDSTVHSTPGSHSFTVTRFALWMAFNMLMIGHGCAAVHSSVNVYDGKAVMFLGESGTGKSTHTRLLRQNFPGMELLNDDSPFVRVFGDGTVRVYGSPWSGKTPCYRQESHPLKAIVRLSQAPYNRITRLSPLAAIGALLPSAPPAFNHAEETSDLSCSLISDIISHSACYHLECLPDDDAARLSHKTIFADEQ